MAFVKATKAQAKLRMAIHGPSGSGKTYSALAIAAGLVDPGATIALVDTENGSASKYAGRFDFLVDEVKSNYNPQIVEQKIAEAVSAGAAAIVFDSLTHFWNGSGGFLELVDQEVNRQKSRPGGRPDSFAAWKVVDPIYKRMVHAIQTAPIHVIVTLRAKTEYERSSENGKSTVKKLGLAPEMRDNFQYEMDVEGMLDLDHRLVIGKTRCEALDSTCPHGGVFERPGADVAAILRAWLSDGAPASPAPAAIDLEKVADEIAERASIATTAEDVDACIAEFKAHLGRGSAAKKETRARAFDAIEAAQKRMAAPAAEQATAP